MANDCIFCKIINKEIPSVTIYEDDSFIAILDKFPTAYGHVLVMPKEHQENIFEASEETLKNILVVAKKILDAFKKMGIENVNLLQNNGEVAGQTVNHLHLHLIPRTSDDNVEIIFDSKMKDDSDLLNIKELITKNM